MANNIDLEIKRTRYNKEFQKEVGEALKTIGNYRPHFYPAFVYHNDKGFKLKEISDQKLKWIIS